MNVLPVKKQLEIIKCLVEGAGLRQASRTCNVRRETCSSLMVRFGFACVLFLEKEMQDLELRHLQIDEIWTYCRKKQGRCIGLEDDIADIGDQYLFTALDQDTRLIPTFRIGQRDRHTTRQFIQDLYNCLKKPKPHESDDHDFKKGAYKPIVRLTTDGFPPYPEAIDEIFGPYAEYGQLTKTVSEKKRAGKEVSMSKKVFRGEIDPKDITTSLVERSNLTIRTFVRRFNRRTLAFSKSKQSLLAAVAMFMANYNYCHKRRTLKTTPAVAAGLINKQWKFDDLFNHCRERYPNSFYISQNDKKGAA